MRRDQLDRIRAAIGPGPVSFTVPTEPDHTFAGYLLADQDADGAPIEHGARRLDIDPRELADLWPCCHFCTAPASITWTPHDHGPPLRFCPGHERTHLGPDHQRAGKITRHRPRSA